MLHRMAQGLHLSQKMALSQVLAPQLQQSLALLQAPTLELKALIEQELQQNPVLEENTIARRSRRTKIRRSSSVDHTDPAEPPADVTFDPATEKPTDPPTRSTISKRNSSAWHRWTRNGATIFHKPMRRSATARKTKNAASSCSIRWSRIRRCRRTLLEQVRLSELIAEQRPIAEMIIGNIDDYGYLQASVDELAFSTNIPAEQITDVLKIIQSFHPPGVGARDLRECLLLQLERADRKETLEYQDRRPVLRCSGQTAPA